MKVFSKNNDLGNKSLNTIKLHKNNFVIPKTFIIGNDFFDNIKFLFLSENKKYILRPSFDVEDSENTSFAGFFKSIYPLNKLEIEEFFKSKNFNNLFNGKNYKLNSIIIQEFIETNCYGVYFSRNPENILEKGFYEIGKNNDDITSGKTSNKKLNYLQKKELEIIGKKIENIFLFPADIEFCIKNNKIIILQSRAITTGNNTIYRFDEIKNFNGIYENVDFDEISTPDYFSFEILKGLFNILYLDNKIYFKKQFFPSYLFKNTKNSNFHKFYKKYLIYKTLFNFIKIFIFQKLDKNVLKLFFCNYFYSFNLNQKSNLELNFDYNTNFITKLFLKTEKLKNLAFIELEKLKINYDKNNFTLQNKSQLNDKIIFINGIIINKIENKNNGNIWIYKGKIEGIITNLENFKYKKNLNQILILNDLNFELYDKIDYINGLIIKNGNLLSHNSIVLREYKIPSIIKYENFEKLKIGDFFSI